MTEQERRSIVEDELFLLRDSGELPEIAYHSSLYYLTEDQDGPGLVLTESEQRLLQEAALERCQEIILRDLMPDNRDLGIYRGPQRSISNWQRYCRFCQRIDQRQDEAFRESVAQALVRFIRQEAADVEEGWRASSVNCTSEELFIFAEEVGVSRSIPDFGRLFWR
ncbi:MAG: hypothetical protein WGN25_20535 [Candidatus Electrothrix sp. GW3-4]|uniref:hypothetical protein n=1 Tax=Candidatus Electrothrix sp. GW3-4 TaxID=3126740 RepID=UPI0030D0962C